MSPDATSARPALVVLSCPWNDSRHSSVACAEKITDGSCTLAVSGTAFPASGSTDVWFILTPASTLVRAVGPQSPPLRAGNHSLDKLVFPDDVSMSIFLGPDAPNESSPMMCRAAYGFSLPKVDDDFGALRSQGWRVGYDGLLSSSSNDSFGTFGMVILACTFHEARLDLDLAKALLDTFCTPVRAISPQDAQSSTAEPCLERGANVQVVSSPFALSHPRVLSHCVTRGVIVNVSRGRNLFLSDARSLPGSEGGLVRAMDTNAVIGVMSAPFHHTSQEKGQVFSLVVSMSAVVSRLQQFASSSTYVGSSNKGVGISPANRNLVSARLTNALTCNKRDGVVRVHTSSGVWGSAVILPQNRSMKNSYIWF